MSPESLEWWKNAFKISGVILLLFTFIAGAGVLWFSRRLNVVQAEQLRQFDKGLTEAKERVANAELRTAELLTQIQPRYFTDKQKDELSEKLRIFAGLDLLIATHWNDAESIQLARQIQSALNHAGIGIGDKLFDHIGRYPQLSWGGFGGGGFSGTEIHEGVGVWAPDPKVAEAIAESLRVIGGLSEVTTPPQSKRPIDLAPQTSLTIFVGVKPLPSVK